MRNDVFSAEIIIRKGSLQDVADIASLTFRCWKLNYKGIISQNFLDNIRTERLLENRKKYIQENPGLHLVAEFKNQVVGFCDTGPLYFRKNQNITPEKKRNRTELGEVYTIYIDPDYQHQGIGSILFQEAKKLLIEKNLSPFLVWVLKDNHSSRQFYKKLGGQEVDETSIKFGDQDYFSVCYRF